MSITIPAAKPTPLKSLEVDFSTSMAQGIWQRIGQLQNWLEKNVPIGIVMYFYDSTTYAGGTPIPDPKSSNWLFCNGQQILNTNSPMYGQFTPDLRNYFPRAGTPIGGTGGDVIHNIFHNHGGFTQSKTDLISGEYLTDGGEDVDQGGLHKHAITGAWFTVIVLPPYIDLQPYMRIA